VARKRKQDMVASLRGIAAIIATILAFIAILILLVLIERLVLG
jgi:hypothetical protein